MCGIKLKIFDPQINNIIILCLRDQVGWMINCNKGERKLFIFIDINFSTCL